jgi:drug/metabolite transporter (DMT)-like permease
LKSTAILALTAFIWGMAFVAQRLGMDYVGPFFFNGMRMLLGAVTLAVVLFATLLWRRNHRTDDDEDEVSASSRPGASLKPLLIGGVICGLVLFMASNTQQVGMVYTSASKAGFLTTMYIVLVPILGIFLRHKTHWNTWVSVLVAVVGLYFLSITNGLTMQLGDLVVLLSAMFWACHILVIDHYAPKLRYTDLIRLCAIQFITAGILSFVCMPLFDHFFVAAEFKAEVLLAVAPALLYAGILSTGVGFTLQAIGQRHANPSAASIIMSLEAVFSVVGGMLILNEILNGREILGCILMFAAVILAQLPIVAHKGRQTG